MKELNKVTAKKNMAPERIVQFGEGNFLRAFADWIVWQMNRQAEFNSSVNWHEVSNAIPASVVFEMMKRRSGCVAKAIYEAKSAYGFIALDTQSMQSSESTGFPSCTPLRFT